MGKKALELNQRKEKFHLAKLGQSTISDTVIILNTEIEGSIIMEGAHIDCGRRIIDGFIKSKARVLSSDQNLPKGYRLILGDMSTFTL